MLEWSKIRFLAMAVIALAGLGHIGLFGINAMLAPILTRTVMGEITIATIVGIVTVVLAILLYNRKIG